MASVGLELDDTKDDTNSAPLVPARFRAILMNFRVNFTMG